MASELKGPLLRPIGRTIIGSSCAVWSPYWIKVAFPALDAWRDKPENTVLALSLLVMLFLLIVGTTVSWVRIGNIEWRLAAAAKKYASGAITLDEYGLLSKQILGK